MSDAASDRSSAENAATDRRSADVGIVCVHNGEVGRFLKRLDRRRKYVDQNIAYRGGFLNETIRVAIAEAGTGFSRHRTATQTLIAEHHPAWVISVGFSSSLSPELNAGDLSLASEITDTHGNLRTLKCPIPESRRVLVRRHLVADQHPSTPADKQKLAAETSAFAVDTTSLAVAQVCDERGTRFLSIRAIIDGLAEDVPSDAFSMIFHRNSRAVGGLLGGLVRNLKRAPELNQWRKRTDEAASHLDRFLSGVIVQLAEHLAKRS
ncbi:MAG: hypothetical protein R3C19_22165 [Planctomycetaceae bacterium]